MRFFLLLGFFQRTHLRFGKHLPRRLRQFGFQPFQTLAEGL